MALKLYDQALDISPNDPDVMASKAGIYQAQGNLEQAARCLSQITAQTPGVLESKINQFAFERNYGEAIRLVQARLARLQTEGAMIAAGGFESETAKATHASLQLYLAMIQLAAGDSTAQSLPLNRRVIPWRASAKLNRIIQPFCCRWLRLTL